jgi:hypothetical protein
MSSMTLPHFSVVVLPVIPAAARGALSSQNNSIGHAGMSAGHHFCEGSTK